MPTPNSFLENIRLLKRVDFGFTLVEMAVVIVIIALVGSLGFPGYAAVKRKSSQAACASNMKQVGTAIFLFAGDNDGWLPPGPATHTINSFISDSRFGSDTSNVVDTSNLEYYLTNYITTKSIGGKKRKGNSVFCCPAHDEKRPLIWKRGSCFGGAGGQFGTDGSEKLINVDTNDYFLVDFTKAFTNHSAASLNRTIKNPHGKVRNLLKTDGSVRLESDTKAR
jgi:prepilin-type N-terminal cleavage/methylation domain-containing protein